jgi:hypothetical protein
LAGIRFNYEKLRATQKVRFSGANAGKTRAAEERPSLFVVQAVAGSNPVAHLKRKALFSRAFRIFEVRG